MCVYKLYGPKPYTDKVLNIVRSLKDQGLLRLLKSYSVCASASAIAVPSAKNGVYRAERSLRACAGYAPIRVSAIHRYSKPLYCHRYNICGTAYCGTRKVSAIRRFVKYSLYGEISWYMRRCPLFGVSAKTVLHLNFVVHIITLVKTELVQSRIR